MPPIICKDFTIGRFHVRELVKKDKQELLARDVDCLTLMYIASKKT